MRRKSLIDKKFQLKTTFRIIGIIIIAFIFIIAVTGIVSTDNNRKISTAIADLNRSIDKEKKTVEILFESAREKHDPLTRQREGRLIDNHLETVTLMHGSIQLLKKTMNQNLFLVTVMITTSVLLGVFLYFYLIRLTNRISGPIYVLTRHIHDILYGVDPDLRELRKNDELKDFYSQFVKFIKKR
jgi:predicted PurR-regulated permease PerM